MVVDGHQIDRLVEALCNICWALAPSPPGLMTTVASKVPPPQLNSYLKVCSSVSRHFWLCELNPCNLLSGRLQTSVCAVIPASRGRLLVPIELILVLLS